MSAILQSNSRAPTADRLLDAAVAFADNVLRYGRKLYPQQENPLIADGIDLQTRRGSRVDVGMPTVPDLVLSNPAYQQNLMRLLVGLTSLPGEPRFREAAEAMMRHVLDR